MPIKFLTQGKSQLLLFFAGWGMDQQPVSHLKSSLYDVAVCCDYTAFEPLPADKKYKKIVLIAWSMGVWAAEEWIKRYPLAIDRAIAINGTPYPVHSTFGIPPKVAALTWETLTDSSLQKFRQKMCATPETLRFFMEHSPCRTIESAQKELRHIIDASTDPAFVPSIEWNKAFVSQNDSIFPVDAQLSYWGIQTEIHVWMHQPHYPFDTFQTWETLADE